MVAVWQFEQDATARDGRAALGSGSAPHLTVRAIPAGVDQARGGDCHVAGCVNGGAGGADGGVGGHRGTRVMMRTAICIRALFTWRDHTRAEWTWGSGSGEYASRVRCACGALCTISESEIERACSGERQPCELP